MAGTGPAMTALLVFLLLPSLSNAADISRMGPVLDVQGIVEGDVMLAGGRIGVEAEIAGDLVLVGATIGVGAATTVARNAFVFGNLGFMAAHAHNLHAQRLADGRQPTRLCLPSK